MMNEREKLFSRRQMLKLGMGFGGLALLGSSVFAQQKGTFYHAGS